MYAKFTFYIRKNRKNKKVYYVRFRDPDIGKRLSGISTGKSTKAEAISWAVSQLENGEYRPRKEIKFKEFTKNMFIWEKCNYIKYLRAKHQRFSRGHADNQRTILETHLIPYFGEYKLSKINITIIENFLTQLSDRNYATTSIANYYNTLSIVMKEAYRLDYISYNPMDKVRRINKKSTEKGILYAKEISELFNKESLTNIWNDDIQHMVFNLIAMTTGMRQGEILALRKMDIKEDYIIINNTWDRKYGLKKPKYDSTRIVPIPELTITLLNTYLKYFKNKPEDSLIFFSLNNPQKALDHKAVNKHFYDALRKIGITDEIRKKRNITFHSWRHTFISMLRGKIADEDLKMIVGHSNISTTEKYTHFIENRLEKSRNIQNTIFPKTA